MLQSFLQIEKMPEYTAELLFYILQYTSLGDLYRTLYVNIYVYV